MKQQINKNGSQTISKTVRSKAITVEGKGHITLVTGVL